MRLTLSLLAAAVVLSGCAAGADKTYGPDGREAYNLTCSGNMRNWGMCYEKAGEICGRKGYTIIRRDGEQDGIGMAFRSMVIQCR